MKMDKKLIIGIIVLLALVVFFFPKQVGRGSCGMCREGEYKWIEKSCLGITTEASVEPGCADCVATKNCYGLPYDAEKCYVSDSLNQEISCD